MIDDHRNQPAEQGVVSTVPLPPNQEPIYIRLPKPGALCPLTGLTRSGLNLLILPCKPNDFKPPVKSFSLARKGNVKGVRLISWESLRKYLESQEAKAG